MFWGLHVKSTHKSSDPVQYEFLESVKLSQVALEPLSFNKGVPVKTAGTPQGGKNKRVKTDLNVSQNGYVEKDQKQSPVTLLVEHDNKQFVLCTLDPSLSWQCPLDLVFQAGSSAKFSLRGHGTVHLTGYEIPEEMDDEDDDPMVSFQEEDDDDDYEEDDIHQTNGTEMRNRIKEIKDSRKRKKAHMDTDEDDDDDDEDDEDEEDDEEEDEDDDLDLDVDDDDEDDDDEEDDDEEDDEDD